MRWSLLAATGLSLLAALVPVGPQHALACSCAASELDEALARSLVANADALITGRVKHVSGERDDLVAWVAVEREFKGSGRRELVVETGGLCAYGAMREASRHFLVLYHERGRRFKLHLCSGSFPMHSADGRADLGPNADFLGALARIAPPARPGDGSALSSIWIAAGLAGALAAFAALAAMKRKRRAPRHR